VDDDVYIVDPLAARDDTIGQIVPAGVKHWNGHVWRRDLSLTQAATVQGEFTIPCSMPGTCLLNDMAFVASENLRFAAGKGGVFYTLDGRVWTTFYTTDQIPSIPWSLAFDRYTTGARSLYVSSNGRGVLRFDRFPKYSPPPR
jgi:hypothetical protein